MCLRLRRDGDSLRNLWGNGFRSLMFLVWVVLGGAYVLVRQVACSSGILKAAVFVAVTEWASG